MWGWGRRVARGAGGGCVGGWGGGSWNRCFLDGGAAVEVGLADAGEGCGATVGPAAGEAVCAGRPRCGRGTVTMGLTFMDMATAARATLQMSTLTSNR
jgi:hypothetical protein